MLILVHCLLAASAAQQPALKIAGHVLDSQGRPAKDAVVLESSPRFRMPMGTDLQAQATCGADGAFELTVPDAWVMSQGFKRLALWAFDPQLGLSGMACKVEDLPARTDVVLHLEPPTDSDLLILDAAGNPVANARVEPRMVDLGVVKDGVPLELCARLAATTDAQGHAKLHGWPLKKIASFFVESDRCGRQELRDQGNHVPYWADGRLQLEPVTSVDIVGSDGGPKLDHSIELELSSYPAHPAGKDPDPLRWQVSTATAQLVDGRAHVDAIGAGGLALWIGVDAAQELRPTIPQNVLLAADAKNEVRITWQPGVRVTGRVVTAGLGSPVAGARVAWTQYPARSCVIVTGADGRFTAFALPGPASIEDVDVEAPRVGIHGIQQLQFTIPPDAKEHDLGDIRLPAGETIRGTVMNGDRTFMAGAWVCAKWPARFGEGMATAVADEHGDFQLWPVPEGESLELTARCGGLSSSEPTLATAHPGIPIEVMIGVQTRVALKGTVVDEDGQPIAGARVEVWERGERDPDRQIGADMTTDAAGRFETPRELRPDVKCCVRVVASGHVPWSSTCALPGADVRAQPRKLVRVEGVIRGPDGNPLEGAQVSTRDAPSLVEAVTDENGRYVLDGVQPGTAVLVVRAEGLLTQGRFVTAGEAAIEWKLDSSTDVKALVHTLDPPLERARELDLASGLVQAQLERAMAGKKPNEVSAALHVAARIDPGLALARIDEGMLDAFTADYVRSEAVQSLVSDHPLDALLLSRLEQTPYMRCRELLSIARSLPGSKAGEKRELIAQALAEARQVDSPDHQLVSLGIVARALLGVDETAEARKVLDAGLVIADKLPKEDWAGFARANFAETLAQVDLERALGIVSEMKKLDERTRHYKNVAQRLAGVDPAAAERVLGLAAQDKYGDLGRVMPAICHAMAPIDLARAGRLAEQYAEGLRGYTYGMMALALAKTNHEAAVKALDEAFRVLRAFSAPTDRQSWGVCDYPVMAAALLPVVEEVEPERLQEFLWQTLAMRPIRAPTESFDSWNDHFLSDIDLALMLARYDRDIARKLLEPALDQFRVPDNVRFRARCQEKLMAALTVVDPSWAAQVAGQFSERAQALIPSILARSGEERWTYVQGEIMWLWVVGQEDH